MDGKQKPYSGRVYIYYEEDRTCWSDFFTQISSPKLAPTKTKGPYKPLQTSVKINSVDPSTMTIDDPFPVSTVICRMLRVRSGGVVSSSVRFFSYCSSNSLGPDLFSSVTYSGFSHKGSRETDTVPFDYERFSTDLVEKERFKFNDLS